MPYYVYVLRSLKDGGLYTGSTIDLDARLRQHNAGKTRSLKHRRPLALVYFEPYLTRKDAMARERYFKTPEGSKLKSCLVAEAECSGEQPITRPGAGAC